MKLSVVIPCYNVEKFLPRAFHALDFQTFRDFEVIFIDDGATDSTPSLLDEYVACHPSAHVQHFPNEGLAEARNRGIRLAKGEYLYFFDPDDYIVPNMFAEMVAVIDNHGMPDAVKCKYSLVQSDFNYNKVAIDESTPSVTELTSETLSVTTFSRIIGFSFEDLYQYYKTRKFDWKEADATVWVYMYNTAFLKQHDLWFIKGLPMGEDRMFNAVFMIYARRIALIDKVYYYYIKNNSGVTGTGLYDPHKVFNYKMAYVKARNIVNECYIKKYGKDISSLYAGSNILAVSELCLKLQRLPFCEGFNLFRTYCTDPTISSCIMQISTKGAPFKLKLPLMLLKRRLYMLTYFLGLAAHLKGLKGL